MLLHCINADLGYLSLTGANSAVLPKPGSRQAASKLFMNNCSVVYKNVQLDGTPDGINGGFGRETDPYNRKLKNK